MRRSLGRGPLAPLALVASLAAALAGACADPVDDGDPEDGMVVPGGKEDDFYSLSAYEYVVEGRTTITLESSLASASAATREARVRELIGYKQIAIAWFLTQYLVAKEGDEANAGFGGMGGLAKAGAYQDLDVTALDTLTYQFTFRQIVAGPRNLMSKLPLHTVSGQSVFDLAIGRPSNDQMARLETNHEWYREAPWTGWNPDAVPADQKEVIAMSIVRERASTDAWFDYGALFSDRVFTIDVHFGWDYHAAYHVKHARALFSWLKGRGFTPPVSSFDKLTRTSGAFTRKIDAAGRTVEVRVRIFYGKSGTSTDPDTAAGGRRLEDDMRASLASADAIVYSGHSGPFYGFALANWRLTDEGDLDDSEMSSVTMPSRYQIVFAEGCDTYQIGDALLRNPAKQGANLDVITTTSFSDASTPAAVQDFIARVTERDSRGRHRPRTVKSLLTDLDANSSWSHTMYGIHGIDDDPALHPYADHEMMCQPCGANADCGGPGNLCVAIGNTGRHCVAACTDDRGCPSDQRCASIASASSRTIYARACVPRTLRCEP